MIGKYKESDKLWMFLKMIWPIELVSGDTCYIGGYENPVNDGNIERL